MPNFQGIGYWLILLSQYYFYSRRLRLYSHGQVVIWNGMSLCPGNHNIRLEVLSCLGK